MTEAMTAAVLRAVAGTEDPLSLESGKSVNRQFALRCRTRLETSRFETASFDLSGLRKDGSKLVHQDPKGRSNLPVGPLAAEGWVLDDGSME